MYAPKANVVAGTVLNPESYFNRAEILPVGIFSLKNEQDEKLMIVPLRFAQSLYGKPSGITEIEVYGLTESNGKVLKERLSGLLGGDYILQNRYEQNATLYKVLNIERWAVYVILTFILLIAACNIIASVTILVAEKQKNIATLIAMGAYYGHIRQIFLFTGSLIGLIGGSIGIVLGLVVCLVQQHYGFISVGNGSSSQAYPVILHVSDFILVFFTLIIISTTTGYITARQVKNVS